MLAIAVVIGIVAGWIGQGRLRGVEKRLRWAALPLAALVIELLIQLAYPALQTRLPLIVPVTAEYMLIMVFLTVNWRQWLLFIPAGVGTLANYGARVFCGGAMPVSPDVFNSPQLADQAKALADGLIPGYVMLESGHPLWFLGDILYTPPPVSGYASIGDLLMALGVAVFLCYAMIQNRPRSKHAH